MLNFIICDDDVRFVNLIEDIVIGFADKNDIATSISKYTDLDDITDSMMLSTNIFVLDVVVKDESGIELAKKIRELNSKAEIIFVSAYVKYAPMGYNVDATAYILKDSHSMDAILNATLKKAYKRIIDKDYYLNLYVDGQDMVVYLKDISFIQGNGSESIIHLTSRVSYPCYMRLGQLEEKLSKHGFLRISKKSIINIANAVKISGYRAFLKDGVVLKTTTVEYKKIINKFLSVKGVL